MKSFILKKRLRKKEEERRTKQSLDLPQTTEANNKNKSFIQYINKISSNRCIKKFSTYFTLPYGFSHRIFSATNHDGNLVTFDIFNFHYFRSVWKKISRKKSYYTIFT